MTPTQLRGLLEAQEAQAMVFQKHHLFSFPFSLISGKVGFWKGGGSQVQRLLAWMQGDEGTGAGQRRHSPPMAPERKDDGWKRRRCGAQGLERGKAQKKGRPPWPWSVRANPGAK